MATVANKDGAWPTVVDVHIPTPREAKIGLVDGIVAPAATVGSAKMFVDAADGDLKVMFGDGTLKVIVADT